LAHTTTYVYKYLGLPDRSIPAHGLPLQRLDCTLGIDISEYGNLTWSTPDPIIATSNPVTIYQGPFVLTFTAPAPTISTGWTHEVSALTATWSLVEPSFSASVSPTVLTLTFTAPAPVVVINNTVTVSALTGTWSLVDPVIGGLTLVTVSALQAEWFVMPVEIPITTSVSSEPLTATWSLIAPSISGAWIDIELRGIVLNGTFEDGDYVIFRGKYKLI
jgi:hypothetical protein